MKTRREKLQQKVKQRQQQDEGAAGESKKEASPQEIQEAIKQRMEAIISEVDLSLFFEEGQGHRVKGLGEWSNVMIGKMLAKLQIWEEVMAIFNKSISLSEESVGELFYIGKYLLGLCKEGLLKTRRILKLMLTSANECRRGLREN